MNNSGRNKLITAYIEFQKTNDGTTESMSKNPHWWAMDTIFDLLRDDPENLWTIMLDILKKDTDDITLFTLSAGPLEDLLAEYGSQFIDRVEEEARINPKFCNLLGGLWKNRMTDELWDRVEKARHYKMLPL